MVEKKTTQRVLSEQALELLMLNVLGGLEGILEQEQNRQTGKEHSVSDESVSLDSSSSAPLMQDPKLSS